MSETVKVADAKTRLSQLLARVEAGDDFVIARGDRPIARLIPIDDRARRVAAIEDLFAFRNGPGVKPVSADEVAAWKHEGHRY
ncbi:type II toxin-antitoxin system Phd/YefM family antitoxin [Salinarimonas chemoclinalis]|uniref:type II toxin-antitoxin system Phd/YefM family antitoxin n=1 Tax=Salinarimonas chemoclinalis TaxID=3241599 RepID=UPI0035563508